MAMRVARGEALDPLARLDDRVSSRPSQSGTTPRRRVRRRGRHRRAASLIIAGAGSGKTNTLAHRVAHLVVSGVDSRRIMLLTFSRRAAAEMTRRVERITAHACGQGRA
jgi:hypothetical protein